jgi:hypothetical protein
MRTTLSIDDDLAQSIENLRNRKNLSLREAINQLLRAGLEMTEKSPQHRPYEGPVFDTELRPGIDPMRMNQLADELEVEEHLS